MYRRIIKNDVLESKLITITTTLFITVSAVLVALATMLTLNLVSSIDTLMEKAESPHYMQMHAGKLNEDRLEKFVRKNKNVQAYEATKFLNIDGSKVQIENYSFVESVEDIGVSVQNENLDYLLDMDNRVIKPKPGELYAPVAFKKQGIAKLGDKVNISGMSFKINGFLRDGSMNSQLAGSKRFLIHHSDFEKLLPKGDLEHIIQFRLKDLSKLNEFDAAYKKAGLEVNGPTGSYRTFKLSNAMSDGMMIGILLIISILVVSMAFMCIRFTLLAKIEEDYKEIGVMKAIGLKNRDIKKIYLAKYVAISVIGSLTGYLISLPMSYLLLKNIKLFMGESKNELLSKIVSVTSILIILGLIIGYVLILLNRFKKVSSVEAIRYGGSNEKVNTKTRFNLRKLSAFPTNVKIGVIDIINRKKIYFTMLFLFMLSTFVMIIPAILYNSISSEKFIENVGFSEKTDMISSLYESTSNVEKVKKIESYLKKDSDVNDYGKYVTKNFKVKDKGTTDNVLSVELGDHNKFPVNYVKGNSPQSSNEIALSTINAEEYKKTIGDSLTLISDGIEKEFIISGIYANLFNGGKTAKANFKNNNSEIVWTNIYVDVKDSENIVKKTKEYNEEMPFAQMNNLYEWRDQTYGSTIQSVLFISIGSLMVALLITSLITSLFLKLLLVKDKKEIAILKALGFTNQDISKQYLSRSFAVSMIGLILGTILSMTVGKVIVGTVASSLGGVNFQIIGSLLIYIGCPLLMLVVTTLTTKVVTLQAGKIDIAKNLKD